jgi:hypothetical protein
MDGSFQWLQYNDSQPTINNEVVMCLRLPPLQILLLDTQALTRTGASESPLGLTTLEQE